MSGQADKKTLQGHVDEFKELLDKPTFLSREINAAKPQRQSVIELLKSCNAIHSAGDVYPDEDDPDVKGRGKPVNNWEWRQYREHLKQYLDERDELPCSCRAHIPAHTDSNGRYLCNHCGEAHDRQTVQEAL